MTTGNADGSRSGLASARILQIELEKLPEFWAGAGSFCAKTPTLNVIGQLMEGIANGDTPGDCRVSEPWPAYRRGVMPSRCANPHSKYSG